MAPFLKKLLANWVCNFRTSEYPTQPSKEGVLKYDRRSGTLDGLINNELAVDVVVVLFNLILGIETVERTALLHLVPIA